jgi:hypothetical protein
MTRVTQKEFHGNGAAHSLQNRGGFGVTLENTFYLSQTFAALAIVGSLLFVGMEVRSSNQVNRHRIIEELLADYRAVKMGCATNADVARAWLSGLRDFAALDPVDKVRFSLTADLFFQTHQSLYLHYRDGRMGGELYEPARLNMTDFLGYPGLQAVWDLRRHHFHSAFRSMVDDTVATVRTGGPIPHLYGESPAQSG